MLLKAGFTCSAQFMTLLMWKIFFNHLCLQLLGPDLNGPVEWFCDAYKDFHLKFRLVVLIVLLVDLDLLTSVFPSILPECQTSLDLTFRARKSSVSQCHASGSAAG